MTSSSSSCRRKSSRKRDRNDENLDPNPEPSISEPPSKQLRASGSLDRFQSDIQSNVNPSIISQSSIPEGSYYDADATLLTQQTISQVPDELLCPDSETSPPAPCPSLTLNTEDNDTTRLSVKDEQCRDSMETEKKEDRHRTDNATNCTSPPRGATTHTRTPSAKHRSAGKGTDRVPQCECCGCHLVISTLRAEIADLQSTLAKLDQHRATHRGVDKEEGAHTTPDADMLTVATLRNCLDDARKEELRAKQDAETAYFRLCALAKAYQSLERELSQAHQEVLSLRMELESARESAKEAMARMQEEVAAMHTAEKAARKELVAASKRHESRVVALHTEVTRCRQALRDAEREGEVRVREALERVKDLEEEVRELKRRCAEAEEQSRQRQAKLDRLKHVTSIIRNVAADVEL